MSDLNRAWWDERVPIHTASEFYDVEGFLAGASTLRSFEPEEIGDVRGLTLVHLQCHFGLDTLSWARLGARVTGLDFSAPAMAFAAELADRAGLDAEWVVSDVMRADEALGGRRFDVVYTGLGALNWLEDIERWADVVRGLIAPGGRLHLVALAANGAHAGASTEPEKNYLHWAEGMPTFEILPRELVSS